MTTARHNSGSLSIEGDQVVARFFGLSGGFLGRGKTAWEQPSQQWPLAEVSADLEGNTLALRGRQTGETLYGFTVDPWAMAVKVLVREVNAGGPTVRRIEPASAPVRAPQVKVKRYRNAREYERDAPTMASQGWVPDGQLGSRGKVNMGRTMGKAVVFLPWAVMRPSRKGDPITVTWVR